MPFDAPRLDFACVPLVLQDLGHMSRISLRTTPDLSGYRWSRDLHEDFIYWLVPRKIEESNKISPTIDRETSDRNHNASDDASRCYNSSMTFFVSPCKIVARE